MKSTACAVAASIVVLSGGCDRILPKERTALEIEQTESLRKPTGRFQVGGTRHYSNGTEVYVLDTQTGQVCYFFVTNDDKPDTRRCAGDPLTL